jgi:exopolyphosphatase/guanosine-5'-triphosphate,3'-diphosphate pyrophosphatase
VATSAVRDADNGEAFLGEIEWSYGFVTRLLSGDEEAATMLRGVLSATRLVARTLVVDIGGGSTELVFAGPNGVESAVSTEAGSVRLTERFLHVDPPTREELDACAAYVREQLPPLEIQDAIGVAGTVTTAASIALGGSPAVHGHRLTRRSVDETLERLASLPLHEREQVAGLAAARAPVIVAGLVVLTQVLARYDIVAVTVSERDILDGAALEAAALPEPEEGPGPPGAYTCC